MTGVAQIATRGDREAVMDAASLREPRALRAIWTRLCRLVGSECDRGDVRAPRERAASGGATLVVAIHAAALGDLDHVALLGRLHRPRLRAVHVEALVAAPAMVVVEVGREDAAEVPLGAERRRCRGIRGGCCRSRARRRAIATGSAAP